VQKNTTFFLNLPGLVNIETLPAQTPDAGLFVVVLLLLFVRVSVKRRTSLRFPSSAGGPHPPTGHVRDGEKKGGEKKGREVAMLKTKYALRSTEMHFCFFL
jgi:hypothetical protein